MDESEPHEPQPESRFIPADERCPYPERWTSTDGDSTEIEVSDVAYGLVRALQPGLCVETGAGFGGTTRRIAAALRENGHGRLLAVERDHARAEALADIRDVAIVVAADSRAYLPTIGVPVQFAWLDSWYEYRIEEANALTLNPGAVVCFHDTAPGRGAHRIAGGRSLHDLVYETFVETGRCSAIDLPTPRGLTVCQVL